MGSVVALRSTPSTENRTVQKRGLAVPARKGKRHADVRTREYLTPGEIDRLIAAARRNRWGQRDATAILLTYRHGLRVSELCALQWTQVDFNGWLYVNRLKNGMESNHPLKGDELRALRALRREHRHATHIFINERGAPMSTDGFRKMLERVSAEANLGFPAHPHMLRHACGYKLANDGRDTRSLQQYLGHKNIQHTVRYIHLNGDRFKGWW
jgi:type 1 fimbriae regulatory protein FimB/type 1 fimbriae regulatory protein FimE